MIFVQISSELYRVIRANDAATPNIFYTVLDRNGMCCAKHPILDRGGWRFYTGPVAKILALVIGHNYLIPRTGKTVIYNDKRLRRAVPTNLVGG